MDTPSPSADLISSESRASLWWQRRLLPLMVGMLVMLTIFFCIASLVQVQHLNSRIEQPPTLDLQSVNTILDNVQSIGNPHDQLDASRWRTLSSLEIHALQQRYHQANVLLMSRIWTNYIGFLTGMILSLVGATFILGKLREPATNLDAQNAALKFTLSTSSPGIVLATLGTLIMLTTLIVHTEITVNDRPLYLGMPFDTGILAQPALPPPQSFDDSMLLNAGKKQLKGIEKK